MEREELLKKNHYKIIFIWECEWNDIKQHLPSRMQIEQQAKYESINIRDALFGGRTEGFKRYHKCSESEEIHYSDITSLHPSVTALDDYAIGI